MPEDREPPDHTRLPLEFDLLEGALPEVEYADEL